MFIRKEDVTMILAACFGSDADPNGEATQEITDILRLWIHGIPLEQLNEVLQNSLIRHLRRVLGSQLLIRDGIRWRRIRTSDLEDAADRLVGLVFTALPENVSNYELVRDWAFRTGSISAMDCLTKRFANCQTHEEQAAIAKVLSYRLMERNEMCREEST